MNEDRERIRGLILRYGWNSTCYQLVNPGFRYWFSVRGDAAVGYVDYSGVWVVGGAPVCHENRVRSVVSEFEAAAAFHSRKVCYFASEERLEACIHGRPGYSTIQLGAQPVWKPGQLADTIRTKTSLRMQIHRARNKGVVVEEWRPEFAARNSGLQSLLTEWLASRGLPSLHFLVEPATLSDLLDRRVFVAHREDMLVGFVIASPIPQRNGWLIEQFVHANASPNGTIEILLAKAAESLADLHAEYLTLGLSPLSHAAGPEFPGTDPIIRFLLRWAGAHGRRFYNFQGLEFFKTKFEPQMWEPIYAIANVPRFSMSVLYAIACAFTKGHPLATVMGGLGRALRLEANWLLKK